jgi:hypothetical protein
MLEPVYYESRDDTREQRKIAETTQPAPAPAQSGQCQTSCVYPSIAPKQPPAEIMILYSSRSRRHPQQYQEPLVQAILLPDFESSVPESVRRVVVHVIGVTHHRPHIQQQLSGKPG